MPGITFGQTYNSGVKYIKINRYDSGGLDRSDYLGQLQSITLTYPDRSAIEYPITTIQEQANFYIYGITPGYNTSSAGEVLNYKFTASYVGKPSQTIDADGNRRFYNWTTVNDNLNYFDNISGSYTFGNTPNTPLRIRVTGSVSASITTAFALLYNTPEISTVGPFVIPSPGSPVAIPEFTFITTGSGLNTASIVETTSHYLACIDTNSTATASLTWSIDILTPSLIHTPTSSLTLFNPDALNFDYNDYNPLLDNAEIPEYSSMWMDVDYSQNPLVPINFGLIISGTADRAFVQDSNYSSKAWSNLRYNGSRTNSYRTT
jgi:hypothetical protein